MVEFNRSGEMEMVKFLYFTPSLLPRIRLWTAPQNG